MATQLPAVRRVPVRGDAGLAVALAAVVGLAAVTRPGIEATGFAVALVGALYWRRTHPRRMVVVMAVVGGLLLVAQASGPSQGLSALFTSGLGEAVWVGLAAVLGAVYWVTALEPLRTGAVAAALAVVAAVAEAILLSGFGSGVRQSLTLVPLAAVPVLAIAAAAVLGRARQANRAAPEAAGMPAFGSPAFGRPAFDGSPSGMSAAELPVTAGQRLLGDQLDAWLNANVVLVDAVIAASLALALTLVDLANGGLAHGIWTPALLLPLAWRRTHPARCVVVVALVAAALWSVDAVNVVGHLGGVVTVLAPSPRLGDVAVFMVVYSASAYGSRRLGLIAVGLGLFGATLELTLLILPELHSGVSGVPIIYGFVLVAVLAMWAFGALRKARFAGVEALRERARLLEVERDQQARLATSAERARIARELHDVVAHSLAVVIAQADGGQYAAAARPAAAEQALATIAETGRRALAEMRELLGVLRDGELDPSAPQPDVDGVPALVDQVAQAGLDVTLSVDGDPRPLSRTAGLAVYRIVQEALTNVMKHVGPAARAQVRLAWDAAQVEVTVTDDGRGAAAEVHAGDAGHGLVGMAERAALCGGRLDAGPRPGGGFEVRAVLPVAVR